MATIGSLRVKIGVDIGDLSSGLGTAQQKISAFAQKGVGGLQSVVKGGLVAGLGAATVGLGALGAGLVKTVSLGSDAEEMLGKFGIVFANTGDQVESSLGQFATAAGRSRFELMGMASTFGDTLKPLGFTEEAAADLSVQLSELAVDLGSFNNMSTDEALRRLQGTLIGSHENALAFGVVINENTLKAEMAANGWDTLTGAELEAAKVQARVNLLMKGTTDAQGDAIRTSAGWANQTRRLQSVLTDTGTAIGMQLLPVITPLLMQLGDLASVHGPGVVAAFGQMVTWVVMVATALLNWDAAAMPVLGTISAMAAQVWGVVEPIVSAVGEFVSWQDVLLALGVVVASIVIPALISFGAAAAPVIAVAALLIGGIALLRMAWESNFMGIRDVTASALGWVQEFIQASLVRIRVWWLVHGDEVKAIVQGFLDAVTGFWTTWGPVITAAVALIWGMIQTVIGNILLIIGEVINAFIALVTGDWDAFGTVIKQIWTLWWEGVETILRTFVGILLLVISGLVESIRSKFGDFDWQGVGRNIVDGIKAGVIGAASALANAAANAARAALNAAKAALGINSPSREFARLGAYSMMGLALGIERSVRLPVRATARAMGDVAGGGWGAVGGAQAAGGAGGGAVQHHWNIVINAPGGEPGAVRRGAEQGVLAAARAMGMR